MLFRRLNAKDFAAQRASVYATEQRSKEKCFRNPSLPIGVYCSIAGIRTFKTFLESLKGPKPKRGIS
jgi:hypothetical protein